MANKDTITANGFANFVENLLGRNILGQGLSDLNFTQKHEDRIAALETAVASLTAKLESVRAADDGGKEVGG